MFRHLRGSFEKKSKQLSQGDSLYYRIHKITSLFLNEKKIPEATLADIQIEYNEKTRILTIQVPYKVVANEISLQLNDLYGELKKDNITLKRVMVV